MVPYRELKKRIDRDRARKAEKRKQIRLEDVFTPRHYVKCLKKCRKGVSFKLSVQKYTAKPLEIMMDDCDSLRAGIAPMVASNKKVIIRERGHRREITPIVIRDRMNQRVLCDYALTPEVSRRLIYDNGASSPGKGVGFARKRFNAMMEQAKRQWGGEFYALCFDFEHFFDSIPHRLCFEELDRCFTDPRLRDVTMQIIESYQALGADDKIREKLARHEGVGVCLGSHVSQLMALCVPNFLDHYLKDVRRVRFYIRYMDDGVILHRDREYLQQLLGEIRRVCAEKGLRLKEKKTRIIPMKQGFTFLKIRYRVKEMKTIRRLCRADVKRMRRRLKRFLHLMERGKMTLEMAQASLQSWMGHTYHAMAYRQRKRMAGLYEGLYGRRWAV